MELYGKGDDVEKLYYNCTVRTMDDSRPLAEAVLTKDGIITCVGQKNEVMLLAGEAAELIDLKGAVLYPGFIDSHMHLLYTAFLRTKTDLASCSSFAETMEVLRKTAEELRSMPGNWLCATGFNQNLWADRPELPNRLDLDAVTGEVPCYITRVCGHVAVYNTRALEELGLMTEADSDKMTFLPDGTPDGRIYESDNQPGDSFLIAPDVEDYKKWIADECCSCARFGLTAVHSDDLNLVSPGKDAYTVMEAFRSLGTEGRLPIRVFEQCRIEKPDEISAFAEKYPCGTEFGRFRTASVKQMMDGSLGAGSAFLRSHGNKTGTGIAIHTDTEINELVCTANANGYPVVAHCIGDGAVDQLLGAFDYAKDLSGSTGIRNGVVHCQIMGTDQLERMAAGDVLAYVQPVFLRADAAIVEDCVDCETARQSYNWRKMWDLGIHVSCGTDCPVETCDPITNIFYAVTRHGNDGSPWIPENAMTAEEALRAYTVEGAYAAGMETRLGTVSVGKAADFTILDCDLAAIDPQEIRNASVIMTVCDGETIYTRREDDSIDVQ